jgi:hypothetical protein
LARGKAYTPVYRQLINTARKGFDLLDESSQNQVRGFIEGKQESGGGFVDRSGKPDLYYSLFGVWLSEALGLSACLQKHNSYIASIDENQIDKNRIDIYIFTLLKLILAGKRPSVFFIFSLLSGKGRQINPVYRIFFSLLIFDGAYGQKRILKFLAYLPLKLIQPTLDHPCSNHASFLIGKRFAGMKTVGETRLLLQYFREGDGFMVFPDAESADLLSTAVSLFSLKASGADLRLLAPDCLRFVNDNYRSGAFVSGDGDEIKDLEYTFYGLLALGSLN